MKAEYTDPEILEDALNSLKNNKYFYVCHAIIYACGSNGLDPKPENLRLKTWIMQMLCNYGTVYTWLIGEYPEVGDELLSIKASTDVHIFQKYRIEWLKHLIQICKAEDAMAKGVENDHV